MTMKYLTESFLFDRSTRSAKFPHQRARMGLALLILTREQYKSLQCASKVHRHNECAWEKKKHAFQKLCALREVIYFLFALMDVRDSAHNRGAGVLRSFTSPPTCRVVCPEGKSGLWTLTAPFTVATDPGRFSPVFCSTRTRPPIPSTPSAQVANKKRARPPWRAMRPTFVWGDKKHREPRAVQLRSMPRSITLGLK
jgi:hypothetical protein